MTPTSSAGVEFHDPKIISGRECCIDLNDDLSPAITVDVTHADRSPSVWQARAVEIRLQCMTWNGRQVLPASRSRVELHDPKIIAARVRRIDLDDDFGSAVAVDIADVDRSTGIREPRTVKICLQCMT